LKPVSKITYITVDAENGASTGEPRWRPQAVYEDFAMTIEILHLAAQIQQWLNQRVARHLAEQAERLSR
jgi:hypothetical protein